MQILFIIAFAMTVLASLFIGNALSSGYSPYAASLGALFSLLGLFMPFMSEYNVLHRSFSKIGDNFKSLIKTQEHHHGEVEIFLPGQRRAARETYSLQKETPSRFGIIVVLIIAFGLISYDAVQHYVIGDGLKSEKGPISNF
ncbi:hypothetical protein [Terasakiella pusilla]|uniref:hypothetical protein n=1 Tax=Terasakiella pusilla TaxID=64973 RepID=UPI003AA9AA8C